MSIELERQQIDDYIEREPPHTEADDYTAMVEDRDEEIGNLKADNRQLRKQVHALTAEIERFSKRLDAFRDWVDDIIKAEQRSMAEAVS